MQSLFDQPFSLQGVEHATIELGSCKSIAIRQLVIEFLNHKRLSPPDVDASTDVLNTYLALTQVLEANKQSSNPTLINVGDCGAAYRFLTAVLSITPGLWLLTGTERLRQRPVGSLINALLSSGADINIQENGLLISGKNLSANRISIDAHESSQFISALLLISPHIGNPTIEYNVDIQPSKPYIRMTELLLQQYNIMGKLSPEKDWSAAIFWYAFALLNDNCSILLKGLSVQSIQGDSVMVQWFAAFGIMTTTTSEGLLLTKVFENPLSEATIDLKHNPDLAPVLSAMASLIPMKFTLTGIENLNSKESMRKDALISDLSQIARLYSPNEDTIVIEGNSNSSTDVITLNSHHDHRLVMAYSLLGLRYRIKIEDTTCINKSYPQFEQELSQFAINQQELQK